VTARQLTFKRIQDTTADDWAIIATRDNTKLFEELPDRLLGALRFLENGDFYTVNGLEHSLQAGTRTLRHGRPVEYVVAALLHDVGDFVGPRNHAAVAAAILRPYVSEKIAWIVEHHTVFQFNHFGRHIGIDADMRDAYLDHPYYEDGRVLRPLRLGELRSVVRLVATRGVRTGPPPESWRAADCWLSLPSVRCLVPAGLVAAV
jgi:hypothetical protein